MRMIAALFNFVRLTRQLYNIDESHAISHSMDVFLKSDEILKKELVNYPELSSQVRIIHASAILHDTVDQKYMNKSDGMKRVRYYLMDKLTFTELDIVSEIISKMSYSYVKVNGFPELGKYQMAYHIVREADLLAAYDIKRSIIFDMEVNKSDFSNAHENSEKLFENRMGKYLEEGLFITETGKALAKQYEEDCKRTMAHLKGIIDQP
jgi:HD superfamily phosphodiesterase